MALRARLAVMHGISTGETRACRWSAVMVEGVHLVPFRTQKLSPPAPMVLSGKPMEEQDIADLQQARKGVFWLCQSTLFS